MLILNSFFIVLADYVRVCFHIDGVPWHRSVRGSSVTWYKGVILFSLCRGLKK